MILLILAIFNVLTTSMEKNKFFLTDNNFAKRRY